MGLLDTEKLQKGQYDPKRSGVKESKSVPSRPQVAPKSGGCRVKKNAENERDQRLLLSIAGILLNNAYKGLKIKKSGGSVGTADLMGKIETERSGLSRPCR